MIYKISIEGQLIDMPEAVATDDGKIKAALAPYFPGVSNSTIKRADPVMDTTTGEQSVTVTVIKMAGTKGAPEAPDISIPALAAALIENGHGMDLSNQESMEAFLTGIRNGIAEELRKIFENNLRLAKAFGQEKEFIVIDEDEPYYMLAYGLIRDNESAKGAWSYDDEQRYQAAKAKAEQ